MPPIVRRRTIHHNRLAELDHEWSGPRQRRLDDAHRHGAHRRPRSGLRSDPSTRSQGGWPCGGGAESFGSL